MLRTLGGMSWGMSSPNSDYPRTGEPHQLGGLQPEDRVRVPGGGPDLALQQQILVHERLGPLGVPHGRHRADGEAGLLAHVGGIGHLDRLGEEAGDLVRVDAIGAAGEDEHGLTRLPTPEDERLDDLDYPDAEGVRGFGRAARGPLELHDLRLEAPLLERFPNPQYAAMRIQSHLLLRMLG